MISGGALGPAADADAAAGAGGLDEAGKVDAQAGHRPRCTGGIAHQADCLGRGAGRAQRHAVVVGDGLCVEVARTRGIAIDGNPASARIDDRAIAEHAKGQGAVAATGVLPAQQYVATAGIECDARAQMHAANVEGVGGISLRVPRAFATGIACAEVGAAAHHDASPGGRDGRVLQHLDIASPIGIAVSP